MPQVNVLDPFSKPEERGKARSRKLIRAWGWFIATFTTLIPIGYSALDAYEPDKNNFLHYVSNEELMAVALALSAAATVDVVFFSYEKLRPLFFGLGFIFALITLAGCVSLHDHNVLRHFSEDSVSETTLILFSIVAVLAFVGELFCET